MPIQFIDKLMDTTKRLKISVSTEDGPCRMTREDPRWSIVLVSSGLVCENYFTSEKFRRIA